MGKGGIGNGGRGGWGREGRDRPAHFLVASAAYGYNVTNDCMTNVYGMTV